MPVLVAKKDHYNGMIVDPSGLPADPDEFKANLAESLEKWNLEDRRGIWLNIPIEFSHLITVAVDKGFVFHHAQPDYVMLIKWLPKTKNTLPNYATYYVGVGGLVINNKNEVLVIKEKNGPVTNIWKVPGGMVDKKEEIFEAAMREVYEETGIKTEFVSLLCFRQHSEISFGLSDLYFICRLKPLTLEIKKQEEEIAECKWMPAEEFFNLPYYQGLYKKIIEIEQANFEGKYNGFSAESLPIVFRPGNNFLYYAKY